MRFLQFASAVLIASLATVSAVNVKHVSTSTDGQRLQPLDDLDANSGNCNAGGESFDVYPDQKQQAIHGFGKQPHTRAHTQLVTLNKYVCACVSVQVLR